MLVCERIIESNSGFLSVFIFFTFLSKIFKCLNNSASCSDRWSARSFSFWDVFLACIISNRILSCLILILWTFLNISDYCVSLRAWLNDSRVSIQDCLFSFKFDRSSYKSWILVIASWYLSFKNSSSSSFSFIYFWYSSLYCIVLRCMWTTASKLLTSSSSTASLCSYSIILTRFFRSLLAFATVWS